MPALAAALEGRATPAGGALPKKSNPSKESCGLEAGFGAGGAVWVGRAFGMSAVLGLTGGGAGAKSSNKFTFAAGAGGGCGLVCWLAA